MERGIGSEGYKPVIQTQRAAEKAQALWHKQIRKPTTAANIKMEVCRKLKTPNALRCPGPTATEGINSTRLANKIGKELESWCSDKQRNKLLEQAMLPALFRAAWIDVFVKYNTAIPSYAAVERL
ncbi:hypothetical protein GWK47_049797 [Chionoecetes opilio]|uniref:Uncharacterized protein n=1 Tax=Chionoecetes opilio TaxID=41210 RepID=A0A8J5CRJ3_CHIOP|nr:hypothetical protein GWK47_049797 [Chionoecetes opilio]